MSESSNTPAELSDSPGSPPVAAAPVAETNRPTPAPAPGTPEWLMPFVTKATWRIVFIVLLVLAAMWAMRQAADLVIIIVVACFLALAMVPGVNYLVTRFGWSRGAATGLIFLGVIVVLLGLTVLLIPAIIDMSGKLADDLPRWMNEAQSKGLPVGKSGAEDQTLLQEVEKWLKTNGSSKVLHYAGSTVGIVFKFFTVMMFTFLIAAGEPALRRTIQKRLSPDNQRRFVGAWDTAISQTGGYFYSRLLLMVITGSCTLIVMELIGVPIVYSIPLAFFGAFFVEFIPVVGSYIGISIPVLVTLAEKGLVPAIILLVWAIVYQQIHDYLLSPRISSRTMTINAGVAFGSALLGGALAGPIGALFAMPTAGMVTVFLQQYLPAYPVAYVSTYDEAADKQARKKKHRFGRHKSAAEPDGSSDQPSPGTE